MESVLVVTVSGVDRAGLVEKLAEAIASHGGNWEVCRMAHLAGRFVGLLQITVPGERQQDLVVSLRTISGLDVMIASGEAPSEPSTGRSFFEIELVGGDHPGIVRDVCSALGDVDANVESLETATEAAADSGLILFKAKARLSCPASVDRAAVLAPLEAIAQDLMVEIKLLD